MVDVAVIGGGIIGCSIARELSRLRLRTVVLEKGSDVASGSSKANSGIVHGGYDCIPGTLKARFNVLGNSMFDKRSKTLDFPFKRIGSLVLAFHEEERIHLKKLLQQGIQNGVSDLRVIEAEEIRRMEPNINDAVVAALYVPTGGIVCPYEMTVAFAENAVKNGVEFRLGFYVETVRKQNELFTIAGPSGDLTARVLINAAGLYADTINNMLSSKHFTITPRRGEYCLLDKTEGSLVNHTLFQLPTKAGKGILVTPTADGNLLLGPTSDEIMDKETTATTFNGLREVLQTAQADVQSLPTGKIITSFTGLRAASDTDDFIIGQSPDVENLINVAGIASPGLTSAPAIAEYVYSLVKKITRAQEKPDFQPRRKAFPKFRHMSARERSEAIAKNPDYGQIVCRCEQVTKAEVLAAIRGPLSVRDLDAIKRRTRAGMGRCQGGFCLMRIPEIVAGELHIPLNEVTKNGSGTNLLTDPNKQSL
ncbi:MAG: FAD-dependent oxidoreductase [Clostridiales bacterium]|nr:FAD-dependent oxidoreductase [Clostridiales bacterium]